MLSSELDLRIGAAFTRFQTLRLRRVFPEALADTLISYGSCQFPTLGFVVERYKAIEQFIPEKFWKIKVTHNGDEGTIDFHWKRVRLFDELACAVLFEQCQDDPQATVTNVTTKNKSKWRPLPLDTVELEKLASRKLRINAKEAMRIAERLYTQGLISYPRTETNIFPKELSLSPLVEMQTADPNWGEFAARVLEVGPNPRQGRKSDQAHPPIHPTKYASNLQGDEKKLYEFIVRHFLACVSKDAQGLETIVEIEIAGELFTANGLIIVERNYLEVYPYDRWSDKVMPHYTIGQVFMPTSLDMVDGETSPPNLLTEADLIALMEKHGIGTDATHAEHIETIKSRMYVGLQDHHFVPGQLGMGLVEGYDAMGFEMSKPHLRSELEADLKRICDGVKDPKVVLEEQVAKYRHVFEESLRQAEKIDAALGQFLNEQPQRLLDGRPFPDLSLPTPVCKCSACGCDIIVKQKRNEQGFMLSCQGYPNCRLCIWLPETVLSVTVSEDSCTQCAGSPKKLRFKFKPRSYMPYIPDEYETCIGGCDPDFLETLDIRPITSQNRNGVQGTQERPRATNSSNDSGYSSQQNTLSNRNQTRIVFGRNNSVAYSSNTAPFNQRTQNSSHPNDYRRNSTFNSQTNNQSYNSSYNSPNSSSFSGAGTQNTNNNRSVNNNSGQSPSYVRPSWNGGGNTERENAIVCTCNEDAILLTVRKEGPNTGRQFYKCAKPQGTGCNFFLWADEGDNVRSGGWGDDGGAGGSSSGRGNNFGQSRGSSNISFTQNSSWNNRRFDSGFGGGSTYEDSVQCNCGIAAKRLTVQKEGPNKGREFYACIKERNVQCRFFKWADEIEGEQQSGYGNYSTDTGFGGGRGGTRQRDTGSTGWKRKCGACGEEGHDRRNCPEGGS
ncbi:DNA topoisomerase 3-alpha [Macrobrachium rosenbergii]|uniref:DNA topoisomerase 3-alpha n=1 Tax=Macrobrachium rosenbergii TaxID=79674 RepID=UPI0034D75952